MKTSRAKLRRRVAKKIPAETYQNLRKAGAVRRKEPGKSYLQRGCHADKKGGISKHERADKRQKRQGCIRIEGMMQPRVLESTTTESVRNKHSGK